jgi:broad specificity phosphatase PhoE
MKDLTLVRHGVTEWNATGKYQGSSDIPLSRQGRIQARQLMRALKNERYARAYTSPLSRAAETARIILEPHAVQLVVDDRLREFDFGAWEGLTWDEIVARWPHFRGLGSTSAKEYAPEGGERFENVCERVRSFLDELKATEDGKLLIVTHAGVLHAMLGVLGNRTYDRPEDRLSLSFAPASISRITMDLEDVRIKVLNDVRHLRTPA